MLTLLAVMAGALACAAAAQAAFEFNDSGRTFTGTLTNDTSDPVIDVTMAITKGNQSVSDSIEGLEVKGAGASAYCSANGTAECFQMSLAPGASATFSGTIAESMDPSDVFQGCVYTYRASTGATTCHEYTVAPGLSGAVKTLRVNIIAKQYSPRRATLRWNATVTICNQDPFYDEPFTVSPDASYTTMIHESEGGHHPAWYLPVPRSSAEGRLGKRFLNMAGKPNSCATFRVHNTSGRSLNLRFYSAIHSRELMTLTVEPNPVT